MAKQTLRTSKALNFVYEISTNEFVQSNICTGCTPNVRNYTVDLAVDRHPEYPDIPASVWTVKLSVTDSNGAMKDTVEPKSGPQSLKIPNLVLMEWKIQLAGDAEDIDDVPFRCDSSWHIGPDGFMPGYFEASSLVESSTDNKNKLHHFLVKDVYVCVSLTFIVDKTSANRGLDTLYESSMLSDCKLVCGERDFSAHRAVLAAQSPVFAAMFQNEMEEKSSGICRISDIRPDVLDALLQYVYTRELTKADGKLDALWIAADKYDIQDLKIDCERLILRSMSDDTALDYLNFAAQHGLDKIVVEAAKVIARRPV